MGRKMVRSLKKNILFGSTIILVIMISNVSAIHIEPRPNPFISEPFFTLVAKIYQDAFPCDSGYMDLIQQNLGDIGIAVDVIIADEPVFIGELGNLRNYDMIHYVLKQSDFTHGIWNVYNENASNNYWGYHTSMDWDEELNEGRNEWYINTINSFNYTEKEERKALMWEWQNYLMDEILPGVPLFAPEEYSVSWPELEGYDFKTGLMQSWGKMNWLEPHTGQINTNEIVIGATEWTDLNPIFQVDSSSKFISDACLDPLIWIDSDGSAWPHLAESWTLLNDTHLRINIREGIKWAPDPDNLFLDEKLDAKDVYFTLYCWKEVSNSQYQYKWIKDLKIIDDYTLDLVFDRNPYTTESDPYFSILNELALGILPEHYLNQTQFSDGVTPYLIHPAWNTYATHCFGTSLFEINNCNPGFETSLAIKPSCWWLNTTITDDVNLNWEERFGDFSGDLNQLRIITCKNHFRDVNYRRNMLFENGKLDILNIDYTDEFFNEDRSSDNDFVVQTKPGDTTQVLAFNFREVRPWIGERDPCPGDPSMTKGLAIRKAIAHAISRAEINSLIHGGRNKITNYPIPESFGEYCKPDIIQYNYDPCAAWYYMTKAGYILDGFHNYPYCINTSVNFGVNFKFISTISIIGVILFIVIRKRRVKRIEK